MTPDALPQSGFGAVENAGDRAEHDDIAEPIGERESKMNAGARVQENKRERGGASIMQPSNSVQRWAGIALALLLVLLVPQLNTHADSAVYEYDSQRRVEKITFDDGSVVDYGYDANGNRTSATRTLPPADTTPPTAPGTPTFSSISMSSATASWTAATDNKSVVGYDYRLNAGTWQSLSNVLSTNLTGLSADTAYTFEVRAKDAASNFGPGSSGSFTTPDTVAPSVPTGLNAVSPTQSTVNLGWTASSDNVAVTGYQVFRNGSHIGTSGTTSYSDSGLSGYTTYSYQVRAYDAAGNTSGLSSVVNATTPDTTAPSTPSSLSASAVGSSRIDLSWSGSSDTGGVGLAGYQVFRNGAYQTNTGSTSYSDTGLSGATSYSYTVTAYDGASNVSGQSNTASATTWPTLVANLNKTAWLWRKSANNVVTVDSPVVVTASGGSGTGYTYLWQFISGDTATSVISASSKSTGWSRSVPSANATYTSTWRCRVTDSSGATVYAGIVTVTFRRITNQ